MQLYLDSFGASLRVKNKMFWVKPRQSEGRMFPIRDVNAIFITKGVHISSDALLLAIKHDIPVLIINGIGHLVGQVWSGQYGSISTIRKQQALLSRHYKGMLWIKELMIQKLESQKYLIQRWMNNDSIVNQEKMDGSVRVIHNMIMRFKTCKIDEYDDLKTIETSFRGWEGTASRHYFTCLSQLLPKPYQFQNRSKRPAYDNFNALLNYLYGILYSQVHLSLIKAGIDPFMSIFHADQHNKPTFVYDVIEIYRHWMEEVAIRLCHSGKLPENAFITPDDRTGVWLNRPAKPIVVNSCFEFLNQKIEYNGFSRKRLTHIDLDAQRWATQFKEMNFDND
jgi:CRISPR-associated protein Cas1